MFKSGKIEIWKIEISENEKIKKCSQGNSMKIETLKNLKFRFSLNFLDIFRSEKFRKFSDLSFFDLRFLQEKYLFIFGVFVHEQYDQSV